MSRLVLTRKPGQTVEIGPDVVVSVYEIREGQVRLVVEAPADVKIMRGEITQEVGT
jgi:carbon storage regulator